MVHYGPFDRPSSAQIRSFLNVLTLSTGRWIIDRWHRLGFLLSEPVRDQVHPIPIPWFTFVRAKCYASAWSPPSSDRSTSQDLPLSPHTRTQGGGAPRPSGGAMAGVTPSHKSNAQTPIKRTLRKAEVIVDSKGSFLPTLGAWRGLAMAQAVLQRRARRRREIGGARPVLTHGHHDKC
jgi:hypothetical protein